jgi:hypothetical protein
MSRIVVERLRPHFLGLSLAGLVLLGLWPIGAGGRMPIGGDVTQFSIGLMAEYDRALTQVRLPIWNARWGYGFPGLAESQMGVYYPPHVVVYGLCNTELAYTLNLVAHHVWAAWGAAWLARVLGASWLAAGFGGAVWAFCGFFMIHLPHPWAYMAGSWMPWAIGLGWMLLAGRGNRRTWLLLAGVLAVQMLAGHFQLAFVTQVVLVLLAVSGIVFTQRGDLAARINRGLALLGSLGVAGLLAFVQLWPTWQLARQADTDRTVEYLANFATSPLHLVSYITPALFHASPLWRSLVWDPLHTSPEEHLGYVGLLPLWLAVATAWKARSERAVRDMIIVAVVSLLLSLGPHVPGFRWLCMLPGFSFFRAPARWGLATMLALAMLAALGLDRLRSSATEARGLGRFLAIAVVAPALVVGGVELALSARHASWVSPVFDTLGRTLPWRNDPSFRQVMESARRPSTNPIVTTGLMKRGEEPTSRFERSRGSIYVNELRGTAVVIAMSALLLLLRHWPSGLVAGVMAVTLVDLGLASRLRDLETAPIRPLQEQSLLLKLFAERALEQDIRTVDPFGNLAMVAAASPVLSYRTLDVPALPGMQRLLTIPPGADHLGAEAASAMTAAGATLRVLDPFAAADVSMSEAETAKTGAPMPAWEELLDPALAGWLYGSPWIQRNGPNATRFVTERLPRSATSRAWLAPRGAVTSIISADGETNAELIPPLFKSFKPLAWRSSVPERFEVSSFLAGAQGEVVLVSQLYDQEWRGTWVAGAGSEQPATILPIYATKGRGGWQLIPVPGPGTWTLELWYEASAAKTGFAVGAVAWLAWLLAVVWPTSWRSRKRVEEANER